MTERGSIRPDEKADAETQRQGKGRDHLEVEKRLAPHASEPAQVARVGDATRDGKKHHGADHRLDQPNEAVSKRLHRLAHMRPNGPDDHPQQDGEENLDVKVPRCTHRDEYGRYRPLLVFGRRPKDARSSDDRHRRTSPDLPSRRAEAAPPRWRWRTRRVDTRASDVDGSSHPWGLSRTLDDVHPYRRALLDGCRALGGTRSS